MWLYFCWPEIASRRARPVEAGSQVHTYVRTVFAGGETVDPDRRTCEILLSILDKTVFRTLQVCRYEYTQYARTHTQKRTCNSFVSLLPGCTVRTYVTVPLHTVFLGSTIAVNTTIKQERTLSARYRILVSSSSGSSGLGDVAAQQVLILLSPDIKVRTVQQ